MNPGKGSVMIWVDWVFLVFFVLAFCYFVYDRYETFRVRKERGLRMAKAIPEFEAEFGCRPKYWGYADKVRAHMAQLSRLAGEAAIAQEYGRMAPATFREHQKAFDDLAVAAKAKWGHAMALIEEVDPELYRVQPHWSEEEPYATHKKTRHANLT